MLSGPTLDRMRDGVRAADQMHARRQEQESRKKDYHRREYEDGQRAGGYYGSSTWSFERKDRDEESRMGDQREKDRADWWRDDEEYENEVNTRRRHENTRKEAWMAARTDDEEYSVNPDHEQGGFGLPGVYSDREETGTGSLESRKHGERVEARGRPYWENHSLENEATIRQPRHARAKEDPHDPRWGPSETYDKNLPYSANIRESTESRRPLYWQDPLLVGDHFQEPRKDYFQHPRTSASPRKHASSSCPRARDESDTTGQYVKIEIRVPLSARKDKQERHSRQAVHREDRGTAYEYAKEAGWGVRSPDRDDSRGSRHPPSRPENYRRHLARGEGPHAAYDAGRISSSFRGGDQEDLRHFSAQHQMRLREDYRGRPSLRDEINHLHNGRGGEVGRDIPRIRDSYGRREASTRHGIPKRSYLGEDQHQRLTQSTQREDPDMKYGWIEDDVPGHEFPDGMHGQIPDYPPPAYSNVEGQVEQVQPRKGRKQWKTVRPNKAVKVLGWFAGT